MNFQGLCSKAKGRIDLSVTISLDVGHLEDVWDGAEDGGEHGAGEVSRFLAVEVALQQPCEDFLSSLHHVSIGEEAEVRGKEDDVGDEDDAHVVRDLKNIFNCKDEIITFGQNEI